MQSKMPPFTSANSNGIQAALNQTKSGMNSMLMQMNGMILDIATVVKETKDELRSMLYTMNSKNADIVLTMARLKILKMRMSMTIMLIMATR